MTLSRLRNMWWVVFYPLSCAWAAAVIVRRKSWPARKRYRAGIPVICVGNLHSGGSGKTPLVMALAEKYRAQQPVVVSRGYRSKSTESSVQVDTRKPDGPQRYGDEPWMMANRLACPVYVGRDRARVLREVEAGHQFQIAILDDGFQHLKVAASINLIAISSDRSPDDSYCLPLGELREPLGALRYADAVVLMTATGNLENAQAWQEFLRDRFPSLSVFIAERRWDGVLTATGAVPTPSSEARLAAFCGIAAPNRFLEDLERWVGKPAVFRTYRDHHEYTDADIQELLEWMSQSGASGLITTEKDWVKIKSRPAVPEGLMAARIHYELPENFWYFLQSRLELG